MLKHSKLDIECLDAFGHYHIKEASKCPHGIKVIGENILDMVFGIDYSEGKCSTMTELNKRIIFDYWKTYDDVTINNMTTFESWFLERATFPDSISRALRFLFEHHYITPNDPRIIKNSQEAASNYARRF
jgi:hypothetical protein